MNTTINIIPHSRQRYETCGDWIFDDFGDLHIRISDTGNTDYEFLVGIHEQIEAYLCNKRRIKEKDITRFDIQFEKNREEGNTDEPGDHILAPYRKEHQFATKIERELAKELDIDWNEYSKTIDEL
ncbi:Uncharacterised protein [uncultured archaeon]|nr:Uncharacterised protein [uncultured archaeon]